MKFLRFMLALVLTFSLALPASAMTGNSNEPAHYVSLGDSLAAGMLQDSSIGKGFSGQLAEMLEAEDLLASYNNDFAVPGAKTTMILDALNNDISPPLPTAKDDLTISEVITQADVITISIGANDILANLSVDNTTGTLNYDIPTVLAAITKTGQNVSEILAKIDALNPQVDVFVMGLYNPFPALTNDVVMLDMMVDHMDVALSAAAKANDFYFIPVKETMASNAAAYLPNPTNIHPSELGYKAIAEQFYGPVKEYIGLVPLPEVIEDPLPTFKDITTAERAEFAGKAAHYGIMKGYADGTFKPNNDLTRMHVTSMIVRLLDLQQTAKIPYTDTKKLAPATQLELQKAYAAGLIPNSKTFKPNEKISRLEVAKMIDAAYTHIIGRPYRPDNIAPFTDIAKLSREEKQIVTMLYDFEIATGNNGKFNPASPIKRAHAAKMFVKVKEKLVK